MYSSELKAHFLLTYLIVRFDSSFHHNCQKSFKLEFLFYDLRLIKLMTFNLILMRLIPSTKKKTTSLFKDILQKKYHLLLLFHSIVLHHLAYAIRNKVSINKPDGARDYDENFSQ